jgi:DNA-binding NarL/FixJ family response regulator
MGIAVLLADKDEAFREFVKRLLGQSVQVVAEAATGGEAVRLAAELRPHVVLMDIDITDMDGISATQRMKAADPNVKVVLLTGHEETYLSSTGRTGADSLLRKQEVRSEILAQVRGVLTGFASPWDGRERRGKDSRAPRWDGRERRRLAQVPAPSEARLKNHTGGE